jgi:hypothetical protein
MSVLIRGGERRLRAGLTQPRAREAFAERLHAGASLPLRAVKRKRTGNGPHGVGLSTTARPALRPGGSDWRSCTGLVRRNGRRSPVPSRSTACGTRKTEIAVTWTPGNRHKKIRIGDSASRVLLHQPEKCEAVFG